MTSEGELVESSVARVLWVVWDGASFDVVQRLFESGELPALRSICAGRAVPLEPLAPNCQTPPSLASLFTGSTLLEHRVTGFRTPRREADASFTDMRSGFEPAVVQQPLLWERLAADGNSVGLSHIPWSSTEPGRTRPGMTVVDAYQRCLTEPRVVQAEPDALSLDVGGHEIVVEKTRDGFQISGSAAKKPIVVDPAQTKELRLRHLPLGDAMATRVGILELPDGRRLLVHTGLWEMRIHPSSLSDDSAFVGKLLGEAYHSGAFGPRLVEGGAGLAEQALLESARCQVDGFMDSCRVVLRAMRAGGLVLAYLPTLDEVQHEVFRWWGRDGDAEPRMRDVLHKAYVLADKGLSGLLQDVGPDCAVVVSSDHGAAALRRYHYVNETLARAGLLGFDGRGRIDAANSRVAYHPAENGSVWVNVVGRSQGIVSEAARDSVVDAAERVLREVRDPATGRAPVDVERIGRDRRDLLGDLLLRMNPGYECRAESGPNHAEFSDAVKGGTHVTPTGETSLRGILATNDPEIQRVQGSMTLMDVAPVVERLLAERQR